MNTSHPLLLCCCVALLLSACGSSPPQQTTTVVTTETTTTGSIFGVIESIQLVQAVSPTQNIDSASGVPVAPAHTTYQISVRLNQGGHQVFTQDSGGDLRVGQQVRIDNGIVHHV